MAFPHWSWLCIQRIRLASRRHIHWDILTFIGSALIFLNLFRKIPTEVLLFGIILVAILSPALQGISDYYAFWINGYFEYDLILSDVVLGYLATGYFPIFPWIIFPAIGFVIAPMLFPSAATHSRGQRPSRTALCDLLKHWMYCSISRITTDHFPVSSYLSKDNVSGLK